VLIVDAGPLYAAAATRDMHHERAVELLAASARPLLVPAMVVTEVSYLLSDRIGPHAELAFARAVADGELLVEPVLDSEWGRIAQLTEQYLDLPLGMTDASVVALAERHELDTIASFDHRHFATVRPCHVEGFTLVP
jgi:predicted nucleic acid-binding protein